MDNVDKRFFDLKTHVMFDGLCDSFLLKPRLTDDSFIADGDHWEEWKAAVRAAITGPGKTMVI